jgi:hypothetical protein
MLCIDIVALLMLPLWALKLKCLPSQMMKQCTLCVLQLLVFDWKPKMQQQTPKTQQRCHVSAGDPEFMQQGMSEQISTSMYASAEHQPHVVHEPKGSETFCETEGLDHLVHAQGTVAEAVVD